MPGTRGTGGRAQLYRGLVSEATGQPKHWKARKIVKRMSEVTVCESGIWYGTVSQLTVGGRVDAAQAVITRIKAKILQRMVMPAMDDWPLLQREDWLTDVGEGTTRTIAVEPGLPVVASKRYTFALSPVKARHIIPFGR